MNLDKSSQDHIMSQVYRIVEGDIAPPHYKTYCTLDTKRMDIIRSIETFMQYMWGDFTCRCKHYLADFMNDVEHGITATPFVLRDIRERIETIEWISLVESR